MRYYCFNTRIILKDYNQSIWRTATPSLFRNLQASDSLYFLFFLQFHEHEQQLDNSNPSLMYIAPCTPRVTSLSIVFGMPFVIPCGERASDKKLVDFRTITGPKPPREPGTQTTIPFGDPRCGGGCAFGRRYKWAGSLYVKYWPRRVYNEYRLLPYKDSLTK